MSALSNDESKGDPLSQYAMPNFVNLDIIGLRRSKRTPKPKSIVSMFTIFELMTIFLLASYASTIRSCVKQFLAYANDLTKNDDGTMNCLNPVSQVFNSIQDNDTCTYKQAMEQPD